MSEQPDLFGAKHERDLALNTVSANSGPWIFDAMLAISRVPKGWVGTAEFLRLTVIDGGLDKPHHHNAWGAAISKAIKLGLILDTGKRDHMKTKKSHARQTPIYIRI